MSFLNNCPLPTAPTTAPYDGCVELLQKVGRFAFQRINTTTNIFDNSLAMDPVDIAAQTSWDGLANAGDGTKIVITQPVEDVNFGEPDLLEGGENVDGAAIVTGTGTTTVTAMIRNCDPVAFAALKELRREPALSVYLLGNNKIGAKLFDEDVHTGIPISFRTFEVKDPSRAGAKGDEFMVALQFALPEGWYEDFRVINSEAGFNPFTDVKPSA